MTTTSAGEVPASAWAPLRNGLFVGLWIAGAFVNMAIWMQTVGAAWIMTTLSHSPLMVSLVQTAISLPVFLFGLPGGVIADLVERRRWLIQTQGIMLAAAVVLTVLSFFGALQAWSLLLFTFLLGTGNALSMSAWMVTVANVLPREQMPAAVSINGISINATRALGPALAGVLIAWRGSTSVFLCIAVCMAGVLFFLFRLPRSRKAGDLPPEEFFAGMRSGLRYIRHSPVLVNAMTQVFVFTSCASALWALAPLVAKRLGMGAAGFGGLMAFMGAGAVITAFVLTAGYRRLSLRTLIAGGYVAFAAATLAAALAESRAVVCLMLLFAGVGWMAVNATISTVVQTCAANWVRARVGAVYLLLLMGAMALGGALWGVIAELIGLTESLALAAVSMLVGILLTRGHHVELGSEADFADALLSDKPVLVNGLQPQDGPVSVEISYRPLDAEREDFLRIAYAVGKSRRRNGARAWRLYRDLAEEGHYVERFIVDSWLDYLRQHARATRSDEAFERRLQRFRCEKSLVRRYLHQPPGEA